MAGDRGDQVHIGLVGQGSLLIGGAERQVAVLSRHLGRLTPTTVLLLSERGPHLYDDQRDAGPATIHDVPEADWTGPAPVRVLRRILGYKRAIAASGVDVVVQRIASWQTLNWAIACRLARVPFVYHWASDHDGDIRELHLSPKWLGPRGFRRGRLMAKAQIVITEDQLEAAGGTDARPPAHRLPDLIDDAPAWDPSPKAGPRDAVVWVARIKEHYKQPHVFLDLAAALPHRRFVMAGAIFGSPAFEKGIRDRLAELPNVELLGDVEHIRMPEVYGRARVLVNTSDVEGFCNAFLEAASCGVPTLSLNHDPDRILSKDGAGFCAEGDTVALKEAVEAFFEDDGRWETARAACATVAARYGPASIAARYRDLLTQIVQDGRRR
ncbi:MAG: glycosyltransferase family 4 protein [Thermoplasmatota archaeon]